MKKSRFSRSAQLSVLAEHDSGLSVEALCRKHQISPATFYKWKQSFASESDDDKRRLRQLEQDNARLKKMYAELMIDHEILQEGYEVAKKILAQPNKKP